VERCDLTVNEITLVHTTKNDAWTRDFSNANGTGKINGFKKTVVLLSLTHC